MSCDWKLTYATLAEAEDACYRTPSNRPGTLLPYWCEEHGGFHNGHFGTARAIKSWGVEFYNRAHSQFWRRPVERGTR